MINVYGKQAKPVSNDFIRAYSSGCLDNLSLCEYYREGITPEDCKADFVAAASLYALAAMAEADPLMRVEQIQIGDVTIKRGGTTAASACLRHQAEMMMAPFLKDNFCFRSV